MGHRGCLAKGIAGRLSNAGVCCVPVLMFSSGGVCQAVFVACGCKHASQCRLKNGGKAHISTVCGAHMAVTYLYAQGCDLSIRPRL